MLYNILKEFQKIGILYVRHAAYLKFYIQEIQFLTLLYMFTLLM